MTASSMVSDLLFVEPPHRRDSDCTLDAAGDCCIECGVSHANDPCPDCNGRGFHSAEVEGSEPCGWTGEKQAPANKSPVRQATEALAKALGYEDASDPRFLAGGSHGGETVEAYRFTSEDRALLRDIDEQRALRSFDARKECP